MKIWHLACADCGERLGPKVQNYKRNSFIRAHALSHSNWDTPNAFSHVVKVQVQHDLTNRYLTHTQRGCCFTKQFNSVVSSSICFFLDLDVPRVGLAGVTCL